MSRTQSAKDCGPHDCANQRVLYNKTRESVDAYADMLYDLLQQILSSRATDFNKKSLIVKSEVFDL